VPAPPSLAQRWSFVLRHCALAVEGSGAEIPTMHSMRARLMAYSRGMPEARELRGKLQHVSTLAELEAISAESIASHLEAELVAA
ncbi:MAG: tRNA dihydrouridine synthase DusB, partial [Verrucomicrobiota bacterium]|nr:tRNA dihydrouridine synthase DusB [Verrucomicrobiota bacterium]